MQQQSSGGDGYMGMDMGGNGLTLTFSGLSPWTLPPVHTFNPVYYHEPFVLSSAHPPLFNRRPFGYDAGPFSLHAELQKFTAQEIMDAKALAASKSHSEAERKRRERINNHLAKLRSLLPSTIKTDKASLLAEVIQHVKELKRQTSAIEDTGSVPTEVDEITVDNAWDEFEDGKCVIKASICCEDRSDLLPELIKTLKSLKLRTLRAEITTLGGRLRNVLFITGDDDDMEQEKYSLSSIQEAFKSVMEKFNGDGNVKRQKFNVNILDHYRSI